MPCALMCEYYMYNDEINLPVVGMGVKKQCGKRERTAHTPQSVFFLFQKLPHWLKLGVYVFATE